jgi:hypothetical protein
MSSNVVNKKGLKHSHKQPPKNYHPYGGCIRRSNYGYADRWVEGLVRFRAETTQGWRGGKLPSLATLIWPCESALSTLLRSKTPAVVTIQTPGT